MKDFINKVKGLQVPDNALLITMDVVSLCMNIPHDESHAVVDDILESGVTSTNPFLA